MQKHYLRYAYVVMGMTLIGMVISAPFVAAFGLGLITFAPLLFFYLLHRKFIKAIRANKRMEDKSFWTYVASIFVGGIGCVAGFLFLWELSHGIDQPKNPSAPMLVMAVAGCPLITVFIIYMLIRWQNAHRLPVHP